MLRLTAVLPQLVLALAPPPPSASAQSSSPGRRAAAGAAGPGAVCNFTVDAGTGLGFHQGVLRGGDYFLAVTPATDPVASASVAGCAALCCATQGCATFSLNVPWSLASGGGGCQQHQNCCALASERGPMRSNVYAMNITTGVVQVRPGHTRPCAICITQSYV